MGLGVGLLMVAGLLGVIVYHGAGVFWPQTIHRLVTKTDGKETTVGGVVVQRQDKHGGQGREFQLYTGNKDVYNLAFRFIDEAAVVADETPASAMVVERLEYGNAIGEPLALRLADGGAILAGDRRFAQRLVELVEEATARRAEIRRIEKGQIGANARRLDELTRLHRGTVETPPDAAVEINQFKAEYAVLAAQARQLRALQDQSSLTLRLFTGEERAISLGQVVGVTFPNQLGWFGKLGCFVANLWHFISREPREANTEGGIFPAIFGTFVMTLLMSLAVTPFGVVAAIYLREYAHQGPLVRAVRIAVNNLAGVPSIVFGVFGLGFFVYLVGGSIDRLFFADHLPNPTFGTGGILWSALTLALMTVPVVIVATEEAVAAVPRGAREGSLACGASKWQTIQRIVLPASVPGILTGLILAMARGAGEVAPLMLVGVVKLAPNLPIDGIFPYFHLDQKFMHLGFHIFDLGFQSPDSEAAMPMVFATTLFLIVLVMALNLGAIIIRERLRRRFATAAF
jgi:phosphate transport system permease protein